MVIAYCSTLARQRTSSKAYKQHFVLPSKDAGGRCTCSSKLKGSDGQVRELVLPVAGHALRSCWNPTSTRQTKAALNLIKDLLVYVPADDERLQVRIRCSRSLLSLLMLRQTGLFVLCTRSLERAQRVFSFHASTRYCFPLTFSPVPLLSSWAVQHQGQAGWLN